MTPSAFPSSVNAPTPAGLSRLTLVEQLTARILEGFETQVCSPGDELPSSDELCRRYGVSRPVVREALRVLEARGVIEIANGRRATIRPVNGVPLDGFFSHARRVERAPTQDFVEVRRGLEIESARLAAARRTEMQLRELREVVGAMRDSLDDASVYAEHDVRFHEVIAEASHNQIFIQLVRSVRAFTRVAVLQGRRKRSSALELERMQSLHEGVMAPIAAQNPQEAALAMDRHFDALAMAVGKAKGSHHG